MASAVLGVNVSKSVSRTARWDALFVALAGTHAVVLLTWPSIPVIAIGLWWAANTISHNFIHRPFFRSRLANHGFSAYLSILLGFPQALWRDRHLAHHTGVRRRLRHALQWLAETVLVMCLWATLAATNPRFFVRVYLPGYLVGLALCWIQGYYEHASGATSHYGWIYNVLFFNDGYHVEHHAHPGLHWTALPGSVETEARVSRWPALLRWIDWFGLEALERLVLRSQALQEFVLRSHRQAFRSLLASLPPVDRVAIVGGGLFPRTALILRDLMPEASITIIDANCANLDQARAMIQGVEFANCRYATGNVPDCDLLVIPLSFDGNRAQVYRCPEASAVLVHDWIWRKRGASRVISIALLKRLNLILQ